MRKSGDVLNPVSVKEDRAPPATASAAVSRAPNGIVALGWIIILVGIIGLGAWAALAPLDSGVTAGGQIVVDSQRIKIQHLTGGIVEDILVRDGDAVEQGEVLLRLNRTNPQSELTIVRAQLLSLLAVEARLLAERDGTASVVFPDEVLRELSDPRVAGVVRTQEQLFDTRRRGLLNELAILEENANGIREQIRGYEAQVRSRSRQIALLKEELLPMQRLFDEGYVPRTRVFELERSIAETESRESADIAEIGRAISALSEVRLQKVKREQEYARDIDTQLTEVQREVDGLQARHYALNDQLLRVEIRSPVAGVVVNRKINSIGGVIMPGEDILELVPEGEPLLVEAKVPPQSIELVNPGLNVMVRFSALSPLNPVVHGHVITVSADRLEDVRSGSDYYLARIEVPAEEIERLEYLSIVPGMPVDVVIQTGESSLLHYLLKPIFDHVFSAFRER